MPQGLRRGVLVWTFCASAFSTGSSLALESRTQLPLRSGAGLAPVAG